MNAVKFLLIIGMCVGLDAGECPCKQRKRQPEEVGIFQTQPKVDLADNGRIKRDSNGDRV
jgi:hypothetical protein